MSIKQPGYHGLKLCKIIYLVSKKNDDIQYANGPFLRSFLLVKENDQLSRIKRVNLSKLAICSQSKS